MSFITASYNTSNACLHSVLVKAFPNLLSYPSVACAQASQTEFLTICSGVPSIKYESTIAHKHNKSIFYEKFKQVIEKIGFDKMKLKAPVDEAADVVMTDKGHLNPNPIPISKEDVIKCLNDINDGNL